MRLGVFGGSFDPVHYGHLLLAEFCREACQLESVWFVPAAKSPHKTRQPAAGSHRLEMIRLAIGGHEPFVVTDIELKREGVSYTAGTLEEIQKERPEDDLYFLIGADSLIDFPLWKQPEKICQLAQLIVVGRPNHPEPDFDVLSHLIDGDQKSRLSEHFVAMPLIDLSSREIRRRVENRQSIRFMTPRAVEKYIQTHGLYTA